MTAAPSKAWAVIERVLEDNGLPYPADLADAVLDAIGDEGLLIVESNARKLLPADVRGIRAAHKRGASQVDLAHMYRINPATVSRIVRGHYF